VNDVCWACGKLGHLEKECRSKTKKMSHAHLVEEEEGGLMLAELN
jgi:hypothetical protein